MGEYRIQQISRKDISWPEQERKHFDPQSLADLAATMRVHGILEAIGAYKQGDRYFGVWGQRRWMAAGIAGLELVPTVVLDKPASDAGMMELRLIENLAREALRPLEQASALHQFINASGLSLSEVAKRVGMMPAAVSKSLALLQLPDAIRQKVDAGSISAGAGYELARVEDGNLQSELAEQVVSGSLNRDALAGKIKAIKRSPNPHEQSKASRISARLSGGRVVTLCGSSLTVDSVIATLEELLSRCRSARNKGLELRTMLKVLADESRRGA